VFVLLDAAIGDLVAAAGPGAAVAVFSTTDFEPNATLAHLMPEVLTRINRSLGDTWLARSIRRVVRHTAPLRWVAPCEQLPYNENCTALRINPPRGARGATPDRARLMERVESMLRELTDVQTGLPVVAAIDRPSEAHHGPRASGLPDLLVRYAGGTVPHAVESPRLGRIEAALPEARPGNHAAGGFFVVTDGTIAAVSAMQDLGPMAAAILGVSGQAGQARVGRQ
jgi:hypothetical protein